VAVVLVAICVGAGVAFLQQADRNGNNNLSAGVGAVPSGVAAAWYMGAGRHNGGLDSGGRSTP
jgi:hypothetical protein